MPRSKSNYTYRVVYSKDFQIVITTPKGWARENRSFFPGYTFVDDDTTPDIIAIGRKLLKNGFAKQTTPEQIIYNRFVE
jgi:hypothetical protein